MRVQPRFFVYVFAAAVMSAAIASIAAAEDYPTRTITDIVASTPGGGTDIVSRIVGEQLSKQFGQPFIRRRGPHPTVTSCRPA